MQMRPLFARLQPLLLVLALLPGAFAQADNPVIIELGATQVRLDALLDRFDIAVRGLIAGQGGTYTPDLLEQLYPFMPQFVEQRASELALVDAARQRGIVVSDDDVAAVVGQIRGQFPDEGFFMMVLADAGFRSLEQLAAVLQEEELVRRLFAAIEAEVEIGDLELRVAYEAVRPMLVQGEQVCARHILVDSELEGAAMARAVRVGVDFATLAGRASNDPGSAALGGDLGCFPRGMMVAPFEEAAFAAEVGVVTDAVQSPFGYHVILVYERIVGRTLSLDEVRGQLEQQVRSERIDASIDAIVANAGARTFPERLPSFAEAFGDRSVD
jgi:peptidyl-prolyl cis-trans isomerase C